MLLLNTYGNLETLISEDERSVGGGKIAVDCARMYFCQKMLFCHV